MIHVKRYAKEKLVDLAFGLLRIVDHRAAAYFRLVLTLATCVFYYEEEPEAESLMKAAKMIEDTPAVNAAIVKVCS